MNSIVLVQPRKSGEQTFPFDIAVVSAVLKEKGLDVFGVDLGTVRADERGPVRAAIAKADLVYFSSWTLGLPGLPEDWRLVVEQVQEYRPLNGGETISRAGEVLGVLTSGGYGYTVGKSIAYGYVPTQLATETDFEIEVMGESIPACRHAGALYDKGRERILA